MKGFSCIAVVKNPSAQISTVCATVKEKDVKLNAHVEIVIILNEYSLNLFRF